MFNHSWALNILYETEIICALWETSASFRSLNDKTQEMSDLLLYLIISSFQHFSVHFYYKMFCALIVRFTNH